jgi:asparagine synthase (glutamine-hydrolysing)
MPSGSGAARRRACGRIGGVWGCPTPTATAALERMGTALGPTAQLLPTAQPGIVVDHDGCFLDDAPLVDPDAWLAAVRSGRVADVVGAFVLAFIDHDGSLTLFRDAIGERTLFYAAAGRGLVFASSLRGVLAAGLVAADIHLPAVARFLAYAYLPGRETLVTGVHELLPGQSLRADATGIAVTTFWQPPPEPAEWDDEETLRELLRRRLETAVRRRLPAGGTVAASLSGGLDSSLVVALARRLHDGPVATFSISFGPEYANELPFSSLVAHHCGTEHRVIEVAPEAVLHNLDDSVGLLGDPIGDPLTVPNSLLFREAAAVSGVMLNGEGGDPCFGGPKNLPMLLAELYGDPAAASLARERAYLRAHLKCYDDLPAMLAPEVHAALAERPLEPELTPFLVDPRFRSFIGRLQAVNLTFKGGHHILPKVDALSEPEGVLPRSPLFDRDVVECAFAIPPQHKLKGAVEKYLLKRAVADLLPQAIIDRPKSGMLVPVEKWFQGPLLPQARERLLDGLAPYGLVNRDYLERLLAGRLGGLRPRHGAKIWLLVTLEAWLRRVRAHATADAATVVHPPVTGRTGKQSQARR